AGAAVVAGRCRGGGGLGGNATAAAGGARAGGDPAGGDLIAELGGGDPADPLAVAYRRCLVSVRAARLPVLPSLFQGLAGMGLVLSDLASLSGSPALRAAALRSGQAPFTYPVPPPGGIHLLRPGNPLTPHPPHRPAP